MIRRFFDRFFGFRRKGRVIPCREFVSQLSEFLDREFDPNMGERIRDHLAVCPACQAFLESLEKTSLILHWDPSVPIPEEAAQDLLHQLREDYHRALMEVAARPSG